MRRQILAVAAVGVVTAMGIGAIALTQATVQGRAVARLATLQRLTTQIGEIRMLNSDVSGWQVAYAWDARKVGGPASVDPSSANRAGYLAAKAQLETALAAVEVGSLTSDEQTSFTQVR
ncbi:MAG: hypothetical protein L6311_15390, partial [Cellulomonas sp.]|nr:hypothetical protein [Cellulomonas sp.]